MLAVCKANISWHRGPKFSLLEYSFGPRAQNNGLFRKQPEKKCLLTGQRKWWLFRYFQLFQFCQFDAHIHLCLLACHN